MKSFVFDESGKCVGLNKGISPDVRAAWDKLLGESANRAEAEYQDRVEAARTKMGTLGVMGDWALCLCRNVPRGEWRETSMAAKKWRVIAKNAIITSVRASHRKTLEAIFARPVRGGIRWMDIEALFRELGAEVSQREGSRVGVFLFGEVRVFHRPHPSPDTDKGAVASVRKWLEANGVEP